MSTAKNKRSDDYLGREFIIKREFDAPRELVFKAWTDPHQVAQWWGPRGFTNTVRAWDARPGRALHLIMHAPNGADYPMGGEFREITPPERLMFTTGALDEKGEMLFELLHTVTLVERSGKTLLTIQSRVIKITADAGRYLGGFEEGMTQSLVGLEEYFAKIKSEGASMSTNTYADREIVITRVFDAPREMVWRAWVDPKQVVRWWGPRGFTTTIETMNVKPGGIWKHVMHGPDGADYPNKSIFTEVVEPERIVYTHGGGKKGAPCANFVATWTFEVVEENKTRLTIRSVFPTAEQRDTVVKVYGAIEGGKQTLERLAEELAKGGV